MDNYTTGSLNMYFQDLITVGYNPNEISFFLLRITGFVHRPEF
jgi:hypothetical protein